MDTYWGMEFVEVVDPKQPEGVRVDAMTYSILKATGYYEELRLRCYAEQFVNVFYQKIIAPALDYLDLKGITPEVVAVMQPDSFQLPELKDRVQVQIDDINYEFVLRHEQLTDPRFPDYAINNIAYSIERRYIADKAKYTYNIMSDSERDYLHDVMRERGFDEMSDLYFNPHFRAFRDRGLLVRAFGMYWTPSDTMIEIWKWDNQ